MIHTEIGGGGGGGGGHFTKHRTHISRDMGGGAFTTT